MLKQFFSRSVRIRVLIDSEMETQHGTAIVETSTGIAQVGFAVDRPEVLQELTPESAADLFEQIGHQGYIPQSIEIASQGTRKTFQKI